MPSRRSPPAPPATRRRRSPTSPRGSSRSSTRHSRDLWRRCPSTEATMTTPIVNQAPRQIVELPGERIAGATQLLDTSGNVIGTAANPLATQQAGGNNGVDYSANPLSLSGLTLLATIPANAGRLGFFMQA